MLSVTTLSSSAANTSSVDRSLNTSRPSLNGAMSSVSTSHVPVIFSSTDSIANSFVAFVDSSPIRSACRSSRRSVAAPSVNASLVGSKRSPTASMRDAQWRGRSTGLRRSVMSGIVFLNDSTVSRRLAHDPHALASRGSFWMRLLKFTAVPSISSTFRSRKRPPFQPSYAAAHSPTISHSASSSSMSFSVLASSRSGGAGSRNTRRPARSSDSRLRNAAMAALVVSRKWRAAATASGRAAASTFIGAAASNAARWSNTSRLSPSTSFTSLSRNPSL